MPRHQIFFEIIVWSFLIILPVLIFYFFHYAKNFYKYFFAIFFLIFWFSLIWGRFFEPFRLVVNNFKIYSETLPKIKIAVISDWHLREGKGEKWVQKVVKKLNEQEFDFLVIPGDFLYGKKEKFMDYFSVLKKVKRPIYSVLGNHDYEVDNKFLPERTKKFREKLKEFNLQELKNTNKKIRENLYLIGVEDNYLKLADIDLAFSGIPQNSVKILLAHSPDVYDEMKNNKADLIITGHTHCGQIRFPFFGEIPWVVPVKNKKFIKHFYADEKVFVTCGVGEVGVLARFFNPPEIAILEIN